MENINNYLYELVKFAGDAIFTVGPTQCILSWNVGAEELLGHKSSDIVGKTVDILSPSDNRRQMRSMVIEVMEEGTLKNLECQLVTLSGGAITAYVTASPVKDQNGHVVAVSIIAKDITDQNRLLLALLEKEKRNAHLEAVMSALTTISHHIRNAAMIISARAEVAAQAKALGGYEELTRVCAYQTRRISAVIESLNDVVQEVVRSEADIQTVDISGSPVPQLDIESRLKERLDRLDDPLS